MRNAGLDEAQAGIKIAGRNINNLNTQMIPLLWHKMKSNCLLISWVQSQSAVNLEPRKIKLATVSTVSPSISHEVMGLDALILVF